jgi:hypothetical protein
MTMGDDTIEITGDLTVTSSRRDLSTVVVQSIEGLLVRSVGGRVPHAGSLSINLQLPSGVTEALFLHVYTPKALGMSVTVAGATPGPAVAQIKGHQVLTFAPAGGLTALAFTNAHATEDVNVELVLGCKAASTDTTPAFWD